MNERLSNSFLLRTGMATLAVGGALAMTHRGRPEAPKVPNSPFARVESELDQRLLANGECLKVGPVVVSRNINLIVNDQVNKGEGYNKDCLTPQNEPSIAVNPLNPNNLVAGANDYRNYPVINEEGEKRNDGAGYAYVSEDGGKSWENIRLPGLTKNSGGEGHFAEMDSAGDPSIAFGPDGSVYYANIVFSRTGSQSGVAVSVSHNGGKNWDSPAMVKYTNDPRFFHDKEWITTGPEGAMVSWTRFEMDEEGHYKESPIVTSLSKDGKDWSPLVRVSKDHPYSQGSVPQIGPDGVMYIAFEGASPKSDYETDSLVLAQSVEGKTWVETELTRVYDDFNCYALDWGSSRQVLTDSLFRINSYPSFSIDQETGRLYLAWADDQGAGNCGQPQTYPPTPLDGVTSNQVKLIEGDGAHFTKPRAITEGKADKVFPVVSADAGRVAVSYYTRAGTKNPTDLRVAIRVGSEDFRQSHRLSDASSNTETQFDGYFIGDYMAMAVGKDGIAHPVWTDSRGSTKANQDIYTANYKL